MKDEGRVPFSGLRTAGFWIIMVTCGALVLVNHFLKGLRQDDIIDSGLMIIAAASGLCRLLFHCSDKVVVRETGWRIRRCEEKINGWDETVARHFPEIMQDGGLEPQRAVGSGDVPATAGSERGGLRLIFSRRESPR